MVAQRILVTGGSGAIAGALVRSRLGAGHLVTVLDREQTRAGDGADFVACDLADLASIDAAIALIADRGWRFDGVVHAAGIAHTRLLADEPRDVLLRVLAVNLTGAVVLTQALLPHLNDGGSMVFVTSGTVYKGIPGHTAYVASKAGLVGFVRSLSAELGGRGIRVNAVAPGLVVTGMTPNLAEHEAAQVAGRAFKRPQMPDDTVGAIAFFLSPESRFITGQTLVVDGGSVRH